MDNPPSDGRNGDEPSRQPGDRDYDTLKMVWEQLRAERANQYSRNAAISIVATSLLGFEGVLIFRIPDLRVQQDWRLGAISAMGVSIAILLLCLLDMPFSVLRPDLKKWRKATKRAMAGTDPVWLRSKVERERSVDALQKLIDQEERMHDWNRDFLLSRRRHRVHCAVSLFILAFILLAIAALIGEGHESEGSARAVASSARLG
ncbi:hypothetical protein ACH4U6_22755 [Streptomyces netropsis]|uniref:hypothetical protein n=1 Tax=Streptomyces netropsis TaxID=55404 RepID=UPI0037B583D1